MLSKMHYRQAGQTLTIVLEPKYPITGIAQIEVEWSA